jgi:ferric-dicitrate binding protein FerR (iron transport regulator)
MKTFNRILGVVVVLALISTSALVALAQDQYQDQYQDQNQDQYPDQAQVQNQAPPAPNGQAPQGSQENDPPSRAARLQFMSGSVSVQPHGTDEWAAGALNRPLTNSDNIWADKDSRAEINVGSGLIRIDSESSLTLTNVSDNGVQLQLHQGAMFLHVRNLDDGENYEVDTPNQAFTVLKPGDYRFDVNPDADTTVVTVWRGEGESAGDGPAVRIRENEQARFSNGTSLKNEMHAAPSFDAFDQWAQSRDQRFDHSQSARYVSPNVVGSDDLDEYGSWRNSPEYGNVWVPSGVAYDWAPYRNGHWIWVSPWGWTWVEDEPWGYAPFHYGRWVYYDNYWGWAPGPYYARPYYAPALVAWFGGGGWGVGFGFGGGYGWCPLGFGEPFIPWYGVSYGYFNRVNITNTHITNITNVYNNTYINRNSLHGGEPLRYANLKNRNGFTAVSRDTLVNSRSVARNNIRVSPNEMSRLSPARSLDVRPTRTTMLGGNAGRSTAMPPPRSFARPVVSRSNAATYRGGQPAVANRGGVPNFGSNGGPNSNMRMPERGSTGPASTGPRYVPRPPSAGGMTPPGRTNQGGVNPGMDRTNSRPGYNQGGNPRSDVYRQPGGPMSAGNSQPASAPRPPTGYTPRSQGSDSRGNSSPPRYSAPPSNAPRSNPQPSNPAPSNQKSTGPRSDMRPDVGPMNGGSNGYSSAGDRASYSSPANDRSYSRQSSPYDGSYSRPSPSYSGGSYSRPMPSQSPSYDRGSYSRPAPAYGGGSYSRPAPSNGGGSYGRSAPSYGAGGYSGGGGRSSGGASYGGGRSSGGYSGGGGHASAPSHSSGGSGSSHSSSNSGHNGHH